MHSSVIEDIHSILPAAGDRIKADEPMARHTSFRIGGPADIFIEARNAEEIIKLIKYCRKKNVNYTILGKGSNILVADKGIRGIVISIAEQYSGIKINQDSTFTADGKSITVQAGTSLASLSRQAALQNLTGLEFACGIPGTLGGAIMMNAGAYDGCMAQVVKKTVYLDSSLNICHMEGKEHLFAYRDSVFFHNDFIILQADLVLEKGNRDKINQKMADLNNRRRASQPLELASAGSAFKRPPGYYAGKLIYESGLQGTRVGDAQVSQKHAGFIVNLGSATADEVYALFQMVQEKVLRQTGVELLPEVRFLGEW